MNRIVSKKSLPLDSEVWYSAYKEHPNWPVIHWFKLQHLEKDRIDKLWTTIQEFQTRLGVSSTDYTKKLLEISHIQIGWNTTNVKNWDKWDVFFKESTFDMPLKISLFKTAMCILRLEI